MEPDATASSATSAAKSKKKQSQDVPPPNSGSKSEFAEIKNLIGNLDTKFSKKFADIEKTVGKISNEHEQLMNKEPCVANAEQDAGEADSLLDLGHLSDSDDDFGTLSGKQDDDYRFDPEEEDDKVGQDIDSELAGKFNKGMLIDYNWDRSKKIMEKYPRPNNIFSLKTPSVNSELMKSKENRQKISVRDAPGRHTQELITASISACAGLMSDIKGENLSRRDSYARLSDVSKMLMAAHKRVSQIRRNQMSFLLSGPYKGLCASANIDNTDNEWLFGRDIGRSAEDVARASRLTAKLVDQPAKNWRSRGRGGPGPRGKSSNFRGRGQFPQKRKDQSQFHHTPSQAKYPKKE